MSEPRTSVPTFLLQRTINYLMTRPWAEVNALLAQLQKDSKPIEAEAAKDIAADGSPQPEPALLEADAA